MTCKLTDQHSYIDNAGSSKLNSACSLEDTQSSSKIEKLCMHEVEEKEIIGRPLWPLQIFVVERPARWRITRSDV